MSMASGFSRAAAVIRSNHALSFDRLRPLSQFAVQLHTYRASIDSTRPISNRPTSQAPESGMSGKLNGMEPNQASKIAKGTLAPLVILQRMVLAYLSGISLCLAWSAAQGWYLVLNNRGEELDDRTPLSIAWHATLWPIDACRRVLDKE